MRVYYAHPINIYKTEQEKRDLAALALLGFEIVNPNAKEHDRGYKRHGMEHFRKVVQDCDCLFFRAFPDGSIPAGVATEIQHAKAAQRPIFELPTAISRRVLEIDATRETLAESGHR